MSTETKKMSVVQLTILTFINMAGSGIIMLPSKLAQVGTICVVLADHGGGLFGVGLRVRKMWSL